MNNKKSVTLELIKLLAAYMVVFVHVPFYGKGGSIIDALARFAVPLFFFISGYFSYEISLEKIKKRIKRIAIITAFSSALYFLFRIALLLWFENMSTIVSYFKGLLEIKSIINLIVFNLPFSSGHNWYLLALIYVYIIFYFITKFRLKEKIIFSLSFALLFLHLLLGEFLSVFGMELPIYWIRNFALMGFPLFALGLFAKKHQNKLQSVSNPAIIIAFVIGCIETVVSRLFYGENELHIGSLFILFGFVVVFIKYSDIKYPKCFYALTDCSTYIYVFHILVSDVLYMVYPRCNIDIETIPFLKCMHPLVVCVVSTVASLLTIQIMNWLTKELKKITAKRNGT